MLTLLESLRHRRTVLYYAVISLIFLGFLWNVPSVKPLHYDQQGLFPDRPPEYADDIQEKLQFCAERFTSRYLEQLRDSATSYCTPESPANLTCFHSHIDPDDRVDSFCVSKSAKFEPHRNKYTLSCNEIHRSDDDISQGQPKLLDFPAYWYETGPRFIFGRFIQLGRFSDEAPRTQNYSILIKREGAENPWHSLMEIFSMMMTLDVLRVTPDPQTGRPYFSTDDERNTQIVILDDDNDGPYFDLWRLHARKPIVRIEDIEETALENVIVPLPGASNPMWQGDWKEHACHTAGLLRVFVRRTAQFYGISNNPPRTTSDTIITIIDREESRRLIDQEPYIEEIKQRFEHISVQTVDFANISFAEQIEVAKGTDILVGVHGAGLAHGMFLPSNSAIVEILPKGLKHKGFRNLVGLLNHAYYSAHAKKRVGSIERDWHEGDIFLDKERFIDLVGKAIRGIQQSRAKPLS